MESNNIHPYWFLKLLFFPNLIIYSFIFQHKNEIIASLFKDIFEFTWKAECDKVKRVVVTQDYYCGGLKMDNIDNFIKSSKCSWIKKLTTSNQPWNDILLAIHGHDVVLKKMLDFGDVYIIDILIPQNDSFLSDVFN